MKQFASNHGAILDVIGPSRTGRDFVFIPVLAYGELPARETMAYFLRDKYAAKIPEALNIFRDEWGHLYDSAWVRARLPRLFEFAPLRCPRNEPKEGLVDAAFIACPVNASHTNPRTYLFACGDDEMLNAGLLFFKPGPRTPMRLKIANDFWNLFLAEPGDLSDFLDYVLVGIDIDRTTNRVKFRRGDFTIVQIGED